MVCRDERQDPRSNSSPGPGSPAFLPILGVAEILRIILFLFKLVSRLPSNILMNTAMMMEITMVMMLTFIEHLLYGKLYAKGFRHMLVFNPWNPRRYTGRLAGGGRRSKFCGI